MTKPHFFRFAKHFFYGTLASRVFGMIRDIAMAFYFGSSPKIASFMVAYRLSSLFRRLFGEGTLNAGFVPHFEALQAKSKQKGYDFYRDLLFSLIFVLVVFILIFEITLSLVRPFIIENDVIIYTMVMLPGLAFICLYALNAAFLSCHQKFFLPAIAPVLFNLVWIFAIVIVQNYNVTEKITYLSFAIVVGYFSQFLLTHFLSHKIYHSNVEDSSWYFPRLFSLEVKSMLKSVSYSIVGVGAVQINAAIDTIFAKAASVSGPAYLWYAIRLQQVPFALFAIAISSALLPTLSKALQRGQKSFFEKNFNKAIKLSFALMLICTVAIFSLGAFAINLIYGRGSFTSVTTIKTYQCLVSYSIGLIPQTFVLIIANCFYAKKNYKTPAIASLCTVAVNVILSSFFVFALKMEAFSVALATAISAVFNACILALLLKKTYPIFVFQRSFIKVGCVALGSFFIAAVFGKALFNDPSLLILIGRTSYVYTRDLIGQLMQFFAMASVFFGSIAILARLTKCKDILDLMQKTPSEEKG